VTDLTVEVLNRRAAVAAVRGEAARIGADAEALLDSQAFFSQVTALDPDEAAFPRRVRDLVSAAVVQRAAAPALAPVPQAQQPQPRQWTLDDVEAASPSEVIEAGEAGLLRDLGYAPKRKRR
jgi:hypothetical protein